jgi:hypothetical protein
MKPTLVVVCAALLIVSLSLFAKPQEQTFTGEISDSHCRGEHEPLAEGDPVLPAPQCVKLCVDSGYKYVFVVDDKIYTISNQNQPDLTKFAGQTVKLTGTLKGEAMTVSKIESSGH